MSSFTVDRKPLYALSVVYLMTTIFFILAYRKHYSVDLNVGIFLALFMYVCCSGIFDRSVLFRDGWKIDVFSHDPEYEPLPVTISK